ncbi:MAG: ribonuclease P protein component [Candidatus Staskawiczbacteria bacterium]|jgi:ribonuclease P protein component
MLPKINRIKKKKDFEIIFKKGASFKNGLFVLRFVKNNSDKSRFGFIVSQKVSKKATVRNKIRRRLTEIIKAERKTIKAGTDLVLIAMPGAEKKDFSEIKESLSGLLLKAKIITTT